MSARLADGWSAGRSRGGRSRSRSAGLRTFFGESFAFDHPADDDGRYVAEVRRCFYHDVLAAAGAAQLTPILCAFDATWIEVIDPSRHGFSFERPATIGTGGATCPFAFTRDAGPKS